MRYRDIKHEGYCSDRLHPELPYGCSERAFAEVWAEENRRVSGLNGARGILELLTTRQGERVGRRSRDDDIPEELTQRDARVAATVIQWLGTNVGDSFLRAVRKRAEELEAEATA